MAKAPGIHSYIRTTILLLIYTVAIYTCEGNTAARKIARGENFVPDPNYLFFKNTRARHYRVDENDNHTEVLRLSELETSEATIDIMIHDRWIEDRADLLIFSKLSNVEEDSLLIKFREGGDAERIPLGQPLTLEEVKLLFGAVNNHTQTEILYSHQPLPALPSQLSRQAARVILRDYLRLIEQL